MNRAALADDDQAIVWWRWIGRGLARLLRWLLNLFRAPEPALEPELEPVPPPPPPPGRLRERRSLASPLVVPASGYIFDFTVHAAFVWTASGLYREELSNGVQRLMPYAVRELTALVAGEARHHPPHHAGQLEIKLQQVLAEKGAWRYRWGDVEVICRPSVWVALDERVKRAVEPFWEQLIKLDCEHDVQMKKVAYADKLSREWLAVLTDLLRSPLADGAAKMTEAEFATVVEKIVTERKSASAKLDSLLEEKVRTGDIFDQTEHFELLKERLEGFATSAFAGVTRLSPNGGAGAKR